MHFQSGFFIYFTFRKKNMNLKSTLLPIILSLVVLLGCSRDQNETPANNCGIVNNVSFQSFATNVSLNFGAGTNANSFRIEYGLSGFLAGTGKSVTTSNTKLYDFSYSKCHRSAKFADFYYFKYFHRHFKHVL